MMDVQKKKRKKSLTCLKNLNRILSDHIIRNWAQSRHFRLHQNRMSSLPLQRNTVVCISWTDLNILSVYSAAEYDSLSSRNTKTVRLSWQDICTFWFWGSKTLKCFKQNSTQTMTYKGSSTEKRSGFRFFFMRIDLCAADSEKAAKGPSTKSKLWEKNEKKNNKSKNVLKTTKTEMVKLIRGKILRFWKKLIFIFEELFIGVIITGNQKRSIALKILKLQSPFSLLNN